MSNYTTTRHLNRHLDHEQLCDLLFAAEEEASSSVVSIHADSAQDIHRQHLQQCLICAAELDLLRTSVTGFRSAATSIASQALARRSNRPAISSLYATRTARYISPTFFWAATGILFAAVLPLGLFHHNLNPLLKPHVVVAPAPSTATTAPPKNLQTSESDEALLEGIDQDLSAAIPAPMQPLASTTSSETDSNQNTQRNN